MISNQKLSIPPSELGWEVCTEWFLDERPDFARIEIKSIYLTGDDAFDVWKHILLLPVQVVMRKTEIFRFSELFLWPPFGTVNIFQPNWSIPVQIFVCRSLDKLPKGSPKIYNPDSTAFWGSIDNQFVLRHGSEVLRNHTSSFLIVNFGVKMDSLKAGSIFRDSIGYPKGAQTWAQTKISSSFFWKMFTAP